MSFFMGLNRLSMSRHPVKNKAIDRLTHHSSAFQRKISSVLVKTSTLIPVLSYFIKSKPILYRYISILI